MSSCQEVGGKLSLGRGQGASEHQNLFGTNQPFRTDVAEATPSWVQPSWPGHSHLRGEQLWGPSLGRFHHHLSPRGTECEVSVCCTHMRKLRGPSSTPPRAAPRHLSQSRGTSPCTRKTAHKAFMKGGSHSQLLLGKAGPRKDGVAETQGPWQI